MTNTLPLGREVEYPTSLDRSLLAAVSRNDMRGTLAPNALSKMSGSDLWQCFELACLDNAGRPKIFWLSFSISSESKNIPESKSLKLYLGSLANHKFSSPDELLHEISEAHLEKLGVKLENTNLSTPSEWPLNLKNTYALIQPIDSLVNSESSKIETKDSLVSKAHFFHSFRAVCPVTSQPDYGSILVSYRGAEIEPRSLANYFNSFRTSSGFHEYWAEKMFSDILVSASCQELYLQIFFSRRGGISINPVRQTKGFYSSTPLPKIYR